MEDIIYENDFIFVQIHTSSIPWLKVFDRQKRKEFSQCDSQTKLELLRVIDIIEKEMILYFNPDKINIASFGNYLPELHFHIMARFKNDDYFPESIWGSKQREGMIHLTTKEIDNFYTKLSTKL